MAEKPDIRYGLMGVEAAETSICDIDGANGGLYYRGVPIEELSEMPFEDVAFLLLREHLPSKDESEGFRQELSAKRELPGAVVDLLERRRFTDPFTALQTCLSVLGIGSDGDDDALWISASTSIIAYHHALMMGRTPLLPDTSLDHATDFLRRIDGSMPSPAFARALDADFVLHAEHGLCASTLAVRVAAGAGCTTREAIMAGLSCLSGPRHGGAVQVIGQLLEQLDTAEAACSFVKRESAANRPISGFGHRVYKVEDPRSRIYRAIIDDLTREREARPAVCDVADTLRDVMRPMARFGIAPNDDLAAATLYSVLNFPSDLNLPLFAASRMAGWIAHFREERRSPNMGVPALHYSGPPMKRHADR